MTKKKKIALIASIAALVVVLLAIVLTVTMCGDKGGEDGTNGDSKTHTVEVKTAGGMALEGVGVYVYKDSTLNDLVWAQDTDASGKVSFDAASSTGYVAVLKEVPAGYKAADTYEITGTSTVISLETVIEPIEDLAAVTYEKGDIIGDFSVTAVDGTTYTISEALKEGKPVVLNFWYLNCQPCKMEFPYLQEAYEQYKDDIVLLALNPVDGENEAILTYMTENGLTLPMAGCDAAWEKAMQLTAYPTTVVIDRYGMISLIHKGSVDATETFTSLFEFYTADEYVQNIYELEDILGENADSGEAVDLAGDFEATVPAGATVEYQVYKVSGMLLQIEDADAYVIYENETYSPVDGLVSLQVESSDTFTPVVFSVGNTSDAEKTFKVTFSFPEGSLGNPYPLEISESGQFTASVAAGNEQGVYYTYTAAESGILSIMCTKATEGVTYEYILYNLNTYELRNLSENTETDADGNVFVSIVVNAGDTVQFSIAALPDETNEYPAAEFELAASFVPGEGTGTVIGGENVEYSVTVTDSNGNPLSGVTVSISDTIVTTDANGVAKATLAEGSYAVVITAPAGYKADNSSYVVTKEEPAVTVKLAKASADAEVYTVKVVDSSKNPLKGVMVTVGSAYGTTNASGSVSFTLSEGTYSAAIVAPAGYTADKDSYSFGSSTSITITLKKSTGTENETTTKPTATVTYTVNVTDYKGKAVTGVSVKFMSGSSVKAISEVNSKGVATAKLAKGNYTVELAFSGTAMGYNKATAKLTSSKTTIDIMVCKAATKSENVESVDSTTYILSTGAAYVDVTGDGNNGYSYYSFEPTQSGVYQIKTYGADAKIGFFSYVYGGSPSETAGSNYALSIEVKESMLGNIYFFGLKNSSTVSGAIIEITRTGNVKLNEYDLEWEVYEASKKPSKYKVTIPSGKTLNYFDLSASTSTYKMVLGSDGYYHLNSKTGPIVYVNLGADAPYVSLEKMICGDGVAGGTAFRKYFYDSKGNFVKKEDYTECMIEFIECMDDTYGVYPLTEDLKYMIQNGGEANEWWDSSSPNYLFSDVKNLNDDLAWMFACCYIG